MRTSVRFYKDVLGLEIIYGGEGSYFTSLLTRDGDMILNLEHGDASIPWGRLIFHVSDVDRFWTYLVEKGFHPDSPQDASWKERYFHMPDLMAASFLLLFDLAPFTRLRTKPSGVDPGARNGRTSKTSSRNSPGELVACFRGTKADGFGPCSELAALRCFG
jgi:catechol 2,3-dioxygenase-like lactoylglutathione lyase family enzyme